MDIHLYLEVKFNGLYTYLFIYLFIYFKCGKISSAEKAHSIKISRNKNRLKRKKTSQSILRDSFENFHSLSRCCMQYDTECVCVWWLNRLKIHSRKISYVFLFKICYNLRVKKIWFGFSLDMIGFDGFQHLFHLIIIVFLNKNVCPCTCAAAAAAVCVACNLIWYVTKKYI